MIKVLVTGGGTRVPIDGVRSITNFSTGRYASKLVEKLFSTVNFASSIEYFQSISSEYTPNLDSRKLNFPNYISSHFDTYDDYATGLFEKIKDCDLAFLAAAVSDYTVDSVLEQSFDGFETTPRDSKIESTGVNIYVSKTIPRDSKIENTGENIYIRLRKTQKLIDKLPEINPKAKIIGFKLTVGKTIEETVDIAKKMIDRTKCLAVIANDLEQMRTKLPLVHLVTRDHSISVSREDYTTLIGLVKQLL